MVMFEARVTIRLKKGVSDPEGANTLKALHLLGFNTVHEAKTLRVVDLLLEGKNKDNVKTKVEQMCQRLLTNPVIHSYEINVERK